MEPTMMQRILSTLNNYGIVTLMVGVFSLGVIGLRDRISVGTIIESHESRLREHSELIRELREEQAKMHDVVLKTSSDVSFIREAVTKK